MKAYSFILVAGCLLVLIQLISAQDRPEEEEEEEEDQQRNHFRAPQPTRQPRPQFRPSPSRRPSFIRNPFPTRRPTRRPNFNPRSQDLIPSRSDVHRVTQILQQEIRRDSNLIPAWVQMGFHTCVGGCDGCIDLREESNRGLSGKYNTLRHLHRTHASMMSLADFVALAAAEAANQGIRQAGGSNTVPMRFGRRTCQNTHDPRKRGRFPKGDDPRAIDTLAHEFRLNRQEAISLLGAHSLGRCHRNNLGFEGPWDNTPTSLDNGYWLSLLGTTWVPVRAPGGSTQWVPDFNSHIDLRRSTPSLMMLHADIAVLGHFRTFGSQDTPSCHRIDGTGRECPFSRDIDVVRRYSRDQFDFHREFIRAYVKMLENTRDRLSTV